MSKPSLPLATDGREIGTRAQATRQKLLDATKKLLDRDGVLNLKLVDVTREIGSSPATYYQYFGDIDDALAELCDEVSTAAKDLAATVGTTWSSLDDYDDAVDFVNRYIEYWVEHEAVLRSRNLKAEEGHKLFRAKRTESQLVLMQAIGRLVDDSVASGRLPADTDSLATTAAVLAMLERLTSYRRELEVRGTTNQGVVHTLADILFQTVSGVRLH